MKEDFRSFIRKFNSLSPEEDGEVSTCTIRHLAADISMDPHFPSGGYDKLRDYIGRRAESAMRDSLREEYLTSGGTLEGLDSYWKNAKVRKAIKAHVDEILEVLNGAWRLYQICQEE